MKSLHDGGGQSDGTRTLESKAYPAGVSSSRGNKAAKSKGTVRDAAQNDRQFGDNPGNENKLIRGLIDVGLESVNTSLTDACDAPRTLPGNASFGNEDATEQSPIGVGKFLWDRAGSSADRMHEMPVELFASKSQMAGRLARSA